ncbi:MAG: 50S ribosomal protein L6 [Eubacteriaceae bacterium]|nr:50S ribosomal protein L6 [Eubacteriaceae bacterium]
MSRIGRMPVEIPAGVEITIEKGLIKVKGPKGELEQAIHPDLTVEIEDGVLKVARPSDAKEHRAQHGLARKLISNMVVGVTEGFKKELSIVGVGYRASKTDNKLNLVLGFSHPVERVDPDGITTTVEGNNRIIIEGIDRQKVGQHAANIRAIRPPDAYKGKGVRYSDEVVKLKVGKTG